MKRKKPLKAVESTAKSAADAGQSVLDEAVERITPLVDQAGQLADEARKRGTEFAVDAYDRVQPALDNARRRGAEFASDTYERLEPSLRDAYDRVEPSFKQATKMASEAIDRVQPTLKEAKKRGAKLAAETLDRVQPALDDALDKVTPAVDTAMKKVRPVVDDTLERVAPTVDLARDKVQNDFLPWLAAALYGAAELAKEEVAVLEPEKPKKRGVGKTLGLIALAGAVLAGVIYAVRKLMGSNDSGWETHEPSRPYVADPVADVVNKAADTAAEATDAVQEAASEVADSAAAGVEDATEAIADAGEQAKEVAEDAKAAAEDIVDEAKEQADKVKEKVKDKAKDAADDKGDASPLAEGPYGEGSYVGAEPPEGYEIKGNERSMKYHLQGTGGYERTITDVWFNSTEAAERAGFVRAQR